MLQNFVKLFGGDPNKKEIEKISVIVDEINALESQFEALSDDDLCAKTDEFRSVIHDAVGNIEDEKERYTVEQAALNDILPEAFAVVREASKRTIGLRHFDVQLIGGIVLHQGKIAEMRTGEGKTLVATLALYLNALAGHGAHLITVNDYLARRDARWMAPIYTLLGLNVGVLQMAAVTENGKKAFLVDFSRESPHEDQHNLRMVPRNEAYKADITYGTNSEFGFDYLRDNMVMRLGDKVQRGHSFAIVDEVDNVLIDEARTPLIISGPASSDVEWYGKMAQLVRQLKPEDYEVSEKDRNIALTELGTAHVEQLLGEPLRDPDRPEDVTPEQARLLGYLEQGLRAQHLFKRNKDYLVQAGKVVIVDEFTGRLMPGRRWSDGLHQAVEAKEGVRVEPENVTYATITIQNYFRMYQKLAGMTGTALTEAEEFDKIYKLAVIPIPTNLEYNATKADSPLMEVKDKDDEGYEVSYFVPRSDPDQSPTLWRRKDYPDTIYRTVEAKLRSIVREIAIFHVRGRPQLVGTTSVESSERLSNRLRAEPIRRLMQTLLIRHAWMIQNNRVEDGRVIDELQPLNQPLEQLDAPMLRQMARPLGVSVNPEDPENLATLCEILNLSVQDTDRLKMVLQGGVPHQVLNARKHTEESQIIAGAGAFGAVTIATNMAGRGVDIKLGGDLAEEVIAVVNRVLKKAGHADAYDMSLEERRQALLQLDPEEYGIYESEVKFFLQHFEDMERVKELGGLHVLGSERHDARRIDNQLRGRSARQGDPGSSRFYLSLEDDLMRLFGGQQVQTVMERFRIDDAYPLEHRMVSGMIESSQHRVEGANFDVRKHLLEYDDVLNSQRMRIYSQRDRVFTKQDLTDDVDDLLRAEIEKRVPEALADDEGPWKLLAWLEQVQPPVVQQDEVYPSYVYRLVLDEFEEGDTNLHATFLDLARRAIEAEQEHLLHAIRNLIERTGESLANQLDERQDALETFLEALKDNDETGRPKPQQMLEELSGLVHLPLRLTSEQMRQMAEEPEEIENVLAEQIETALTSVTITRTLGAIENRLGAPLELDRDVLLQDEWDNAAGKILEAVDAFLENRQESLTGANGLVDRDLDALLQSNPDPDFSATIRILAALAQGRQSYFDSKTHRQVQQVIIRFRYTFLAAQLLEGRDVAEVTAEVLEHLEGARDALRRSWGKAELARQHPNATFTEGERKALVEELGRRQQTEIYRQVLLNTITEQWVEYLTRVEALRVSIGLEAYAQRDPLVQYKGQASQMFQSLMNEIRAAVISRIFLYQPRAATVAVAQRPVPPEKSPAQVQQPQQSGKKRKRHKKR